MSRPLYILRGPPGVGKTTLAMSIIGNPLFVAEADQFFCLTKTAQQAFIKTGKFDVAQHPQAPYTWIPKLIPHAHKWCFEKVNYLLSMGLPAVVSNTFSNPDHITPYLDLAKNYKKQAFVIVVENHHGSKNTHMVPDDKVIEFYKSFKFLDQGYTYAKL